MYARVITSRAGRDGFGDLIRVVEQQLPAARQRPGFAGFFLLTDDSTGNAINISLWQTREDMEAVARGTEAGIHDDGVADTGLRSLRLATYEVAVHA